MVTVIATPPKDLTEVKAGQVYEAQLFTNAQLIMLRQIGLKHQFGYIQDEGSKLNTKVVRFL